MHRYLQPSHWWTYPKRARDRKAYRVARKSADDALASLPSLNYSSDAPIVLVDGMYDSPNHYFRLRLFLEAVSKSNPIRPVGVIRNNLERSAKRSLEALGVREFLVLEEGGNRLSGYRDQARKLLDNVHSHWDFLSLDLPFDLPAHIVYDTVLKEAGDPQPSLDSPLWERYLAEALRDLDVYHQFFSTHIVSHVPFSHPWKNEYGTGFWLALHHGIPAYHLTAYFETLRLRRFTNTLDYAETKEKLDWLVFAAMPKHVQSAIKSLGQKHLVDRIKGNTSDINGSRAFNLTQRELNAERARVMLGVTDRRPAALICAHAWYDFPHNQDLSNFSDFKEWINLTYDVIKEVKDVIWLLKPHPLESWYGRFQLAELAADAPDHILLVPEQTDAATSLAAADVVVTVYGTVGLEAVASGKPVIAADRSYYSDWQLTYEAKSRDDYISLLQQAATLVKPSAEQIQNAAAFSYFAMAPHPEELGLLKLICDSTGIGAAEYVTQEILQRDHAAYAREVDALATWLSGDSRSYSVDVKLRHILAQRSSNLATA